MVTKKEVIKDASFNFRDEVIDAASKFYSKEDMERLKQCLQCGRCVGGCPSGRRTAWRIRKIFEETAIGLKDKVLTSDDLWKCTTCYTCQERCPRGIHTTDIVRILRNMAVKNGNIKDSHRKICKAFMASGHAVPINDEMKAVRKNMGLTEVPPTTLSDPEGIKEINKLLEKTGFKVLIAEKAVKEVVKK